MQPCEACDHTECEAGSLGITPDSGSEVPQVLFSELGPNPVQQHQTNTN